MAERLDHLDPHLGRRVLQQLRERRCGAQVADPSERLDGAPARLGVGEHVDQRLDAARVLQAAERLGRGDANPPVRVFQQADRRRDDARVLEGLRHQHRRTANLLVGVGQQLDRGLDQVVLERAHRVERAVARPARERLREHDVAPYDAAAVGHPEQDLEHDRAGGSVARGHQRQDAVREGGALAGGSARERFHQHLLGPVVDERELLDEQIHRAARVVLPEHGQRLLPERLFRVARQPLPARQALRVGRLRGEPREIAEALLDAARCRELPEHGLERRCHGRVEQQAARDLLRLALALDRDLGDPALRARQREREERGGGRAHGGLGLAVRLGDHRVGRLGIGQALEDRQHGVAVRAVRPKQHPGQVLRLERLGGRELGEQLVALLAGLEGLVGKPLEDEPSVLGGQSHARSSIAGLRGGGSSGRGERKTDKRSGQRTMTRNNGNGQTDGLA